MPFVDGGSFTFAMKGSNGRKVFDAHAIGELQIKERFMRKAHNQ